MDIKVSICVPIYGVELYIKRCAVSLLEQTYSNLEYIFVNDCTKDNSISILNDTIMSYPHRQNQIKIIVLIFKELVDIHMKELLKEFIKLQIL